MKANLKTTEEEVVIKLDRQTKQLDVHKSKVLSVPRRLTQTTHRSAPHSLQPVKVPVSDTNEKDGEKEICTSTLSDQHTFFKCMVARHHAIKDSAGCRKVGWI